MPGHRRRVARSLVTLLATTVAVTLAGATAAFAYTRHGAARPDPVPVVPASVASSPGPAASARSSPSPSASPPASRSPSASPTATPGPYRVVGLGDSVPAGTACGCTTYVTLVAQKAAGAAGRTAEVSNLAQPGLTTSGLAAELRQSTVRDAVDQADLVIVTIGANDFDESLLTADRCQPAAALSCYQSTLAQQRTLLSGVLAQIDALHPHTVLVTGYWNVFLDGAVGRAKGATYVQGSDALTRADNAVIAAVAAGQGDRYVDIYTPFKGGGRDDTGLLAADGDHPDAAGHQLIARTLLAALG